MVESRSNLQRKILSDYWRSDRAIVNAGDFVTEILINHFGFSFFSYHEAVATGSAELFNSTILIVGTLLDSDWFHRIPKHKVIWGCGYSGDPMFDVRRAVRENTFLAVRGPLTASYLGLPDEIPVGDPALLLPRVRHVEPNDDIGVGYVPHFNSRGSIKRSTLKECGADRLVDIACTRETFWDLVQSIVNARFILTSSLHGAIIAQAYGRPWALCTPAGVKLDKPFKWHDWFAYLGVEFAICEDSKSAMIWWEHSGRFAQIRDLDPLLDCCPLK